MSSPEVLEAELVTLADVMPSELQHPPAVRQTCACGKKDEYAHGYNAETGHRALTCSEVLQLRARVNADLARRPSLLERLFGGAR
jgi:hypothetical protein